MTTKDSMRARSWKFPVLAVLCALALGMAGELIAPAHGLRLAGRPTQELGTNVHEGRLLVEHAHDYHFFQGTQGQTTIRVNGKTVVARSIDADGIAKAIADPVEGVRSGEATTADDQPTTERGVITLRPGLYDLRIEHELEMTKKGEVVGFEAMWGVEAPYPAPIPWGQLYAPGAGKTQIRSAQAFRWMGIATAVGGIAIFLASRMESRRRRVWAFRFAAAGFGIFVVLGAGEVAVRVLDIRPHEYIPGDIYSHYDFKTPGAVTRYVGYVPYGIKEFEVEVRNNSAGWRDTEHDLVKAAGTRRIMVIGDSYIEGNQVELEKTVSKRLEATLNRQETGGAKWEVMAMGKGGFGTLDELRVLREQALRYDPDLIILGFFPGNDVVNNDLELEDRITRGRWMAHLGNVVAPRIRLFDRWLLIPSSQLNVLIVERLGPAMSRAKGWMWPEKEKDVTVYPEQDARYWEAWNKTTEALLKFRDAARAEEADLLVTLVYSPQTLSFYAGGGEKSHGQTLDASWPHQVMRKFCAQNGMECLDLEPVLRAEEEQNGGDWHWRYDMHWNERGHEIAAEALAEWVRSKDKEKGFSTEAQQHGEKNTNE